MSFASPSTEDGREAAEREHVDAKEAVQALRTLVAEGKVKGDALALAEYRLAAAGKALTRIVTAGAAVDS